MKIPFIQNIFGHKPNHPAPAPPALPAFENRSTPPAPAKSVAATGNQASPAVEISAATSPTVMLPDADVRRIGKEQQEQQELKRTRDLIERERVRAEFRKESALWIEEVNRPAKLAREAAEASRIEREKFLLKEKTRPRTWEEKMKILRPPQEVPLLTKEFVAAIVRKAGLETYMSEQAQKMKPINESFAKSRDELIKVGHNAVSATFRQIRQKQCADGVDGTDPEYQPLPDRAALESEFENRRFLARQKIKKISSEATPIILSIAARLQSAARDVASELHKTEQTTATDFGLNFEPSNIIGTLIWWGFNFEHHIKSNWIPGPMGDPRDFLFGLLDDYSK